jgi:O-6-methylguanine DNA methyltransferase
VEESGGDVKTAFTRIDSPIGKLLLSSDGESLTGLFMEVHRHPPARPEEWIERDDIPVLKDTAAQLSEYFAGTRNEFDVPLLMIGTPFQKIVWQELRSIPYGKTISYGELAQRIGNPNASRAVGLANGRNPISIIVPCHRVIGASGSLTGYGGGLERKKTLLDFEGRASRTPLLDFD